ncbi:MAG: hypothetical protein COA78_25300 [Blastopirellula sp.]|nr:MAG: hypothetical protein COA78_25300 [Blastopirellula sp.]
MADVVLPIANGFYLSDSLPVSAQECVGFYPNIVEAPALNAETLFGTPGYIQQATSGPLSADVNRESITFLGKAYFVNGNTLYRKNADNTLDSLGSISGAGRVTMIKNIAQIMILVPGGAGYIFTTGPDSLVTITDGDFNANGAPQYAVFNDGFFVCSTDANKFIVSALNDGVSWGALDFGSAESSPDNVTALYVYRNQLFVGGEDTIEGFTNTGGADFPYQRSGLFFDEGIFAPFSIVNAQDSVMFVGGGKNESPAVWMQKGNALQKVSTTAIDSLLQTLTDTELADVFGWAYSQKGAYFTGFTLPHTTIVFDTISGRWHERKSRITTDGITTITRLRVNSVITAYGKLLVGDSIDGRIGEMSVTEYQEYDNPIFRRIATQPFQNNMKSIFVPSIELTMESGVGNAECPDPVIRMDRSVDGKTFSPERVRSIGKVGEYNRRAIWRRNGRASRFEIFRWTMTDAVKPVIIQATANIVGGAI